MKKLKTYLFIFLMYLLVTPVMVHADLHYVGCGSAEGIPQPLVQLTRVIYTFLVVITPIVLIAFSIITMIKALKEQNADEVLKAKDKLIKKFIAAGIILLIGVITRFVLLQVVSNDSDQSTALSCMKCFLYNADCHESDTGNDVKKGFYKPEPDSDFINDTKSNRENYKPSNQTSTPGTTSNDSSGTPASGGVCGSDKIYKGTTYTLSDSQKQKIAGMIMCEYGTDLNGMKAVASQMANLYEIKKYNNSSCVSSRSFYEYITAPVCRGCCGWYACYSASSSTNANALKAVEDVIINGNRTLPLYIDEFDMYPGEISPKLQPSEYKQGETVISGDYGGHGKFWCVTPSGNSGNLFYYTSDSYKQHVGG
jgi:hypothetical protein